jgi:hypothetical protein
MNGLIDSRSITGEHDITKTHVLIPNSDETTVISLTYASFDLFLFLMAYWLSIKSQ